MTHSPGFLLTVLAFALVIGPLIFLHEMGHYLAGRLFGVKIDAFSIGFGQEVFGFTDRRGTRWKFSWMPLGGYVKFAGDMNAASAPGADWLMLPPEERARTLQAKPVWQRAIVVAAGPIANFIVAICIMMGFALAYGVDATPATIGIVAPKSAAASAGLQPGDRITSIGGRHVETFSELADYTLLRPDQRVTITFVRGATRLTRDATLGALVLRDNFGNEFRKGLLGIGPDKPVLRQIGLFEAPLAGLQMTGVMLQRMLDGLGQIITGIRPVNEMGGPLSIARLSGEQFMLGAPALLFLIANISINLGFINLLPVPILDGGHLFFYAIEAIQRRPVPLYVQEWAFRGGLAAILALMLMVTFNDLGSFGLWKHLTGLIG